ncbi:PcfK-like family protein [Sphingobacterium sp. lm-10]|uniref:PcfK-like family protein n=1 Tax=Sphingobacterium sp. lm-10 TaxID=2944904 RepID=UPI0020221218|nr:PcfK-like family protein [Sphingobacterium sp. lm-10]MCL7987710.1 PcfK-like family protein [Sphingobacterium sp. lm-10]
MQVTDAFKDIIQNHLTGVANTDGNFAKSFANPKKKIEDCITYILNTVKSSGKMGFADDEIFGMAMHYYDEETIDIGKPISGKVIVNRSIEKPATSEKPVQQAKAKKPIKKDETIISKNQLTMF